MICRSTLKPVTTGVYTGKAARELFGNNKPISSLPFSRQDFFLKGPEYITGMSISGVQQKLSLKINADNEFEMVSIDGEFILKPSPESFPFAAENEQCAMALSRIAGIETGAVSGHSILGRRVCLHYQKIRQKGGKKTSSGRFGPGIHPEK